MYFQYSHSLEFPNLHVYTWNKPLEILFGGFHVVSLLSWVLRAYFNIPYWRGCIQEQRPYCSNLPMQSRILAVQLYLLDLNHRNVQLHLWHLIVYLSAHLELQNCSHSTAWNQLYETLYSFQQPVRISGAGALPTCPGRGGFRLNSLSTWKYTLAPGHSHLQYSYWNGLAGYWNCSESLWN